ncbi:Gldg family protein [Engelhardtia mirabilis]|uniref:ABC-type uncharacterized transport system n=1 Tax=Engelhardtia mirabilis TaxID=2528011 RepID=A0A518BI30_9BACT|nr:ABC-type uncharacterized transport system [Planctomycetes bacterium Pla133]QDV00963.1 ABC-type uncharacterized transport system [Planctomycetes bacterium Pla86]
MKPGALLASLITLGLLGAVVSGAVDVARQKNASIEVGNLRLRDVNDRNRAFLEELADPVRIVYYASEPASMPSELRHLERGVLEVLEAIREVAPERVRFEIVDPAQRPEVAAFATQRRLAPFRVRTVQRDGWTEREVWSTLEISLGARDAAVVNGLLPEHLPRLQSLICAHLKQLEEPARPRIAFAAPSGFSQLRGALAQRGEVLDVDLDGGASLPDDADLLFWMQPTAPTAARLDAVERWRAQGRGLVIAASARAGEFGTVEDEAAVDLRPRDIDVQALWATFGLRAVESPVFDRRCESLILDGQAVPVPFLFRCIAPNQDFRGLPGQPNGNLLFATPSPLELDGEALAERGFEAQVLATSSELSWSLPGLAEITDPEPLRVSALVPESGRNLPKQPLLVLLSPPTSFEGSVVAAASASPFADEFLDSSGYAHRRLVSILLDELTSDERLVMARADFPRPQPLPELTGSERLAWRAAVVGLGPALVLLIALLRGALRPRGQSVERSMRPLLLIGGLVAVGFALGGLGRMLEPAGVGADFSGDGLNRPAEVTIELAEQAASSGGLELEWILSREADLPPRMRAAARSATRRLADLAGSAQGVELTRTVPEELEADALGGLAERGIAPFRTRTTDGGATTVRSIFATLELRAGGRVERLAFPDALSFEDTEFRVAFALWRLGTGERPVVALASDLPRLSPAEAHTEYQLRQLFAPSGTDVYSLARGALERAGFDVEHVDNKPAPEGPSHLTLPEGTRTVVWLQPRRDVRYVLEALANHLHGGGSALVAAQHFRIIPQRYRGREFELAYWPQPQSADIDELWFPEFGVELERTVVFDELKFSADLATEVNRETNQRDYEAQASALPFLIRASSADYANSPMMGGVGDLALPFANAIDLDPQRLAALGLESEVLIETSERSWSFDWEGGDLPQDVLEGPPDGEYEGRRNLAVRLRGRFPLPAEPLRPGTAEDPAPLAPAPGAGDLVLIGASECFKNRWLLEGGFRSDHFLVNAVAHLTLPPEVAALTARRDVPRGLEYVEPDQRLAWRVAVLAGGPAGVLVIGLALRLLAAARMRRATRQRNGGPL